MLKDLLNPEGSKIDLTEIYSSSNDIIDFDTHDPETLANQEFIMAWGIARKKSEEVILLIKILLMMKKKYNVSDFDFALFLEGFDGETLFGDE
jgi:hypothetical protein